MALLFTNMIYYQESGSTRVKAETVAEKTIGFLAPEGYALLELSGTYNTTQKVTSNTAISLTGDTTITVSSGNGILLADNITVYIVLNGHTLNVKTSARGMAGIRVPRTSTLIVKEGSAVDGQLIVKGGPGTAPTAGSNGEDALDQDNAGSSGSGGNGGHAPGAGIGGDGGTGGTGGSGRPRPGSVTDGQPTDRYGANGNVGTPRRIADNGRGLSGDVYLYGQISVTTTAGDHKTARLSTAIGGDTKYLKSDYRAARSGGGGGSGAGGSAYGAAGIGSGGVGGGGGGSGGAGGGRWRGDYSSPNISPAGGGGGGAGQTGGPGGNAGIGSDGINGNDGQNGTGHSGGNGGLSDDLHTQNQLGKVYVSTETTLNSNNSSNSTMNSASNAKFNNGFYLLSELDVQIKDPELIKYTGSEIKPTTSDGTLSIKDKKGNDITSVLNTNYTLSYENNIDAGDMTAKVTIKSAGDPSDPNYLYVDGGSYTFYFTIHQNDDPISIKLANATREYTYGESFQATIETAAHTPYLWNNPGTIKWEGEQDGDHTGNVGGANSITAEVFPTKVGNGNLKLKVSIIQEGAKNANGIYNFTDVSATLDEDIKLNHKSIDESDISLPALREYLYIGGQIQPHYTIADGNSPIEFKTNKDTAHKVLEEGVDYELIYDENITVKDGGKVTVKGIGNYDNSKNPIPFVINARSLNDPDVKVALVNPEYTGKELRPQPVITIFGNILPTTDYDLNWKSFKDGAATGDDLINVGKKQLEITGKNNLKDSRNQEYGNVQADIDKITLDITQAKDVIFDGKEIESRPTLKYNGLILTEDGTLVDASQPILNPNDYRISFSDHKEVGTATITLTGMENYKGVKTLSYNVLPRTLYIQPDSGQWKYYGAKDIFGVNQTEAHPTYRTYIRALNPSSTEELKTADATADEANLLYVKNDLPIPGYAIQLENNLSREGANDWINVDQPDTTYKFTIDGLKLSDATKKNYEVKLIDNEATYKLESYIYGGPTLTLNGTIGKNDWYVKQPATLKSPSGFTISKKNGLDVADNPWNNEISYPDGDYSKDGIPYFLRVSNLGDPSDGAISKGLNIKFKQDTVAPTGNVVVDSDSWSTLNKDVIFDYYLNSDARGLVYAKDAGSQVNTKHYYISDKKMSNEELEKLEVPYEEAGGYNPLGKSSQIAIDVDTSKDAWISESQFIWVYKKL